MFIRLVTFSNRAVNHMKQDSVPYQEKESMPSFRLSKICTISFHAIRKRCEFGAHCLIGYFVPVYDNRNMPKPSYKSTNQLQNRKRVIWIYHDMIKIKQRKGTSSCKICGVVQRCNIFLLLKNKRKARDAKRWQLKILKNQVPIIAKIAENPQQITYLSFPMS